MSAGTEVRIEGDGYYALWRRNDRAWGHAIDVELFDLGGACFGRISFACHPEFTDYEKYQSMNTYGLVQIVSERLRIAMREGSYAKAWDQGSYLFVRFNAPEQEVPTCLVAIETRTESAFPLKRAPSYASSLQIGASYCLL
jgi:hypothetical protein